jgi:carboxynorspermidine decarboxylase
MSGPAAPLPVPTPCFVIDLDQLERNLRLLCELGRTADCRVLLAMKAFALPQVLPLIGRYLHGASVSSLSEARLARELIGGDLHMYAPAYRPSEFEPLLALAPDALIYNSLSQWNTYRAAAAACPGLSCGLRLRPTHSGSRHPVYRACGTDSPFGVPSDELRGTNLSGVHGALVHVHCQDDRAAFGESLRIVEAEFDFLLSRLSWLNLGGGQLLTTHGYELEALCDLLRELKRRYRLELYLEPGQAVVWEVATLVTTVLDVVQGPVPVAILDASAIAHVPDFLHAGHALDVREAGAPGTHSYRYRLSGCSCSSLDVFGEFAFAKPLRVGAQVTFLNQADYTLVQANTFNGIDLPNVAVLEDGQCHVIRRFGAGEYRARWPA